MTTVAEMKAAIAAAFDVVTYGAAWEDVPQNPALPANGLKRQWCYVRSVEDGLLTIEQTFPLITTGTGQDADPCFCGNFRPVETDAQRFQRLTIEKIATFRTDQGGAFGFVNIAEWGVECARGEAIRTVEPNIGAHFEAIVNWTSAEKTAVGLTALSRDDSAEVAVLANDTTEIGFADGSQRRLTVTANRTLTTTVPRAGTICTLLVLTSGTTSRTITFGDGFTSEGPLLTGTTGGRVFAVQFRSSGTALVENSRTAAMVP